MGRLANKATDNRWDVRPNSATTISVPPTALMNAIRSSNASMVCCSMALMVKYVLTQGSETRRPRRSRALFSSAGSVGYLWPMLHPW